MKLQEKYIIRTLLVIVGVLIGIIITMYSLRFNQQSDQATVTFTKVARTDDSLRNSNAGQEISGQKRVFQNIAEQVTPTVVYIESMVSYDKSRMPDDENHDFGDRFWDDIMPERRARTVGSGVIINSSGYILTNNHVVEGAGNSIEVTLKNKQVYDARTVGRDPNTDLAVLKIDAQNLPRIVIGDSDDVEVGEWVLAIGNPFRLRSTVTAGIVSALSRQVRVIDEQMSVESFIQTDAAINRGNSGGALVNSYGELIGINTAIATETGNYQGYGFAVPVNLAIKVAEDIIEYGTVKRALLGVTIDQVDYDRATELGMNKIEGVEIVGLIENGAAEEFGLNVGDVILSVDKYRTNEVSKLQERIAMHRPGDTTSLKIWRDGDIIDVNVELKGVSKMENQLAENAPTPDNSELELDEQEWDTRSFERYSFAFGITVIELPGSTDLNRKELIITEIKENSDAWKQGFRKGDEIISYNNREITSLDVLQELVNNDRKKGKVGQFITKQNDGTFNEIEIAF